MFALQKPTRRKELTLWQIVFCLTVISLLCRSVIASGYMPDTSGQRDNNLAISLCHGGGSVSTLLLTLTDQSKPPSSEGHASNQACAFGLALSQAVLPSQVATVQAGMMSHRPAVLLHGNEALPPLPALGPPLGPRAPPVNLG